MEHHHQEKHTRASPWRTGRRWMKNPMASRLRSAAWFHASLSWPIPVKVQRQAWENATTSRGLCVTALDAGYGSSDRIDLTARGRRGHGVEWKGMQADNLGGKVHPS
ncbi:hypothetical protein CCUS01_14179 [Colletotrichum cuscutae]|uniref:Uncharacterized protein n=1 Tax=Colletotrichum cuscutae TaxID=1209917 RepID=A0AAJ0DM93_9PEZI|nr:hypothetical protein CCUS01_14179 [Colletotrichum cuscutae]